MRVAEMSQQLWKSQKNMLLLLGGLLVLNLLLFAVLEQLVAPQVAAQESRFLKRQAEVRQLLHNKGGASKNPQQHFVLASQDLSRFHQAIPDYQEFTGLIEELLVLSVRAGLNINQISYSPEEMKTSPLLKFSLNFNVAGDYGQLKRFIHSLEQSVRLITIKQIGLQSADNDKVNLHLSLETFFRPERPES